MLECLAQDDRPLSALLAAVPRYYMAKERRQGADPAAIGALLARVEALYPQAAARRDDGLKLVFPDGAWLTVRQSNTEPVVRIAAESADPEWAHGTVAAIRAAAR